MSTTFTLWDGSAEQAVALTMWDGAAEHALTEVGLMPGGAWSTTEFLNRPGANIGHRGASADLPEGSRRAMTEAVRRRIDALELPLSRTSDGVWFGLHDQTLLRTSGVDIDPTTLTWAQVQAYQIAVPAGGDLSFGARPYMRLTTLLEDYGSSHVLLLDPKYHGNSTYRGEFLDLVEATLPDARQHVVVKYHISNITLADYARSRGFTTWGYAYEGSDYLADPALTTQRAGHWDWLGLNWDASQPTWDAFAAFGKPLIGHVVADTTERTAALAAGADAVMCAGVYDIQGAPEI